MSNREYIESLVTFGVLKYNETLKDSLELIYYNDIDIVFLLKKYQDEKNLNKLIGSITILLIVYEGNRTEQEEMLKILGDYLDKNKVSDVNVLFNRITSRALRQNSKESVKEFLHCDKSNEQ